MFYVCFKQLEMFKLTNQDNLGPAERTVEQAIEKTKTNIAWRDSYEDVVYEWLNAKLQQE